MLWGLRMASLVTLRVEGNSCTIHMDVSIGIWEEGEEEEIEERGGQRKTQHRLLERER